MYLDRKYDSRKAERKERMTMFKKYTIEMIMTKGDLTAYIPVAPCENGAMETISLEEAREGLKHWQNDPTCSQFKFRLLEWAPKEIV